MDAISLVNGMVFDGTGAAPYRATVRVEDERIVAVRVKRRRASVRGSARHVRKAPRRPGDRRHGLHDLAGADGSSLPHSSLRKFRSMNPVVVKSTGRTTS